MGNRCRPPAPGMAVLPQQQDNIRLNQIEHMVLTRATLSGHE
jgi:hypothetical protein